MTQNGSIEKNERLPLDANHRIFGQEGRAGDGVEMEQAQMSQETEPQNSETTREAQHAAKADWHRAQAQLPIQEKVRILLEMQKQDLPLLARLRPLKYYEKPWDIEP